MSRVKLTLIVFFVATGLALLILGAEDYIHRANPWTLGAWLSVFFGLWMATVVYWWNKSRHLRHKITSLQEAMDFYARGVTSKEFQEMLDNELTIEAMRVSDYTKALATLHNGGLRATGRPAQPGHEASHFKSVENELKHNLDRAERVFYDLYDRLERVIQVTHMGKLKQRTFGWQAYVPKEEARTGTDG